MDMLITLLLLLPVGLFLFLMACKRAPNALINSMSVAAMLLGLIISVVLLINYLQHGASQIVLPWISLSAFSCSIILIANTYSTLMCVIVYVIALLVVIYSIAYKKHDSGNYRYFALIGLFVFSMLGIVFSGNLLVTFVFWELVGFNSYLLIGYLFDKHKAVFAANKAFLVNRVSDVFFLVALLMLQASTHSLNYNDLLTKPIAENTQYWAGLFLLLGCIGKTAQIPFHIWLPDAMEGPTPVSALIHAATMVAAGVFVLVQLSDILVPEVKVFALYLGATTALAGGFFALTQYDIKKVLAFSTVSQLGFMVAAIGAGSASAAFFHLTTHAFFKAGLFLSAGSVILGLHHAQLKLQSIKESVFFDKQDIRNMGGLWRYMPLTGATFGIFVLAITGMPFFTGAMSKDVILMQLLTKAQLGESQYWVPLVMLLAAAACTVYYMFRLCYLVFGGSLRIQSLLTTSHVQIHENNGFVWGPLCVLATLAIALNPAIGFVKQQLSINMQHNILLEGLVIAIIIISATLAFWVYNPLVPFRRRLPESILSSMVYKVSFHQAYIDKYVVRGVVTGTLFAANCMHAFEQRIMQRSVNWFGIGMVVLAQIVAFVDKYIIDGGVKTIVWSARFLARGITLLMNGRVQYYMVLVIGIAIGIGLLWFL